jgi:hypothetical protein
MNFTTDLPKKDPVVSYIVASAVRCEKFFPGSSKEGPVYRMHAVILTQKQNTRSYLEACNKKSAAEDALAAQAGLSPAKGCNKGQP